MSCGIGESHDLRLEPLRNRTGVFGAAVRDVGDLGAPGRQVGCRQFADPTRADQQNAPTRQVAEHLGGQGRGRGRDRRRAFADRRLGANALADGQRLPEDTVEERA